MELEIAEAAVGYVDEVLEHTILDKMMEDWNERGLCVYNTLYRAGVYIYVKKYERFRDKL